MGQVDLLLIGVGVTVLFYLLQKYFRFLSERVFEVESQEIMNFLFFRSFNWFRYSFPGFYILVNLYIVYGLLSNSVEWPIIIFSVILLCCTCILSYKLFVVISANKDSFLFQKSTSSVRYYNGRKENERREVYAVFMRRLNELSIKQLGEYQFVDFLKENYILKLSSIISFERFDHWLENSESRKYTGSLFYSKFKKSIYSELREILLRYDADNLNDTELILIVSVLLDSSLLHFDDTKGLHYHSGLLRQQIDIILNRYQEDILVKNVNHKLGEIERHLQIILERNEIRLEFSELRNHVINSVAKVDISQEVIGLTEKLSEVSEDLKCIKSSSITKDNLIELDQSIVNTIAEFKTTEIPEALISSLVGIPNEIKSLDVNNAHKALEVKLDDLVNAVYTLSPKIIHTLPEKFVLKDIFEFLITDLEHTQKVPFTNKNQADIKKLVEDHFVVNGGTKYEIPRGDYKDRRFFEKHAESICISLGRLAKKHNLPNKILAEIIKQDFPNYYPGIGRIENKISSYSLNMKNGKI